MAIRLHLLETVGFGGKPPTVGYTAHAEIRQSPKAIR